jgi:outer membrane protein OmpA-like peptidoglycan-associated protein/WD40 repeat protein/Mg-chelatase subunit ChlD
MQFLQRFCCVVIGSSMLLVSSVLFLHAQSLRILDLSTDAYPRVTARCVLYDAQKRIVYPHRVQEIVLRENGEVVQGVTMKLPERKIPRSISCVLALDISGSMQGNRLDNAKSAAYTLVEELPLDLSECAITSFDDRSSIIRDFSQNRSDLMAGIYGLQVGGGTDYDAAFSGKTGAFRVLQKARYRKVIVFLTDGLSTADTTAIIRQAKEQSATIYCITLNMPMPSVLRTIAEQTGGRTFENIGSREEAHSIYREILRQELDIQPFSIEWQSAVSCKQEHLIDIALPSYQVRESVVMEKPGATAIALRVTPQTVHFPILSSGSTQGVALRLQALGATFHVLSVTSSSMAITSLTTQFPLEIPAGSTKILRLRYAPQDTNFVSADIGIITDKCGMISVYADGGSRWTRTQEKTLVLTKPSGGEVLWIGGDTVLTWQGIRSDQAINVDMSVNGKPFERLYGNVSGLQQPWNITTGEGDSVRLRITKPWRIDGVQDPAVMTLVGHRGPVNSVRYSYDGTMIVTAGDDATIRVWNAETGDIIRTFPSEFRPFVSAKFVQQDKAILASNLEGKVILYDLASGAVKQTYIAFGLAVSQSMLGSDPGKSDSPEPPFIWVPDGRGRMVRVPNPQYNGGTRSTVTNDITPPIFNRFELYDAALSPDGRSVVGVGEFASPVQWYARTARMDKKLPPLKNKNYSVEFSPSGTHLYVAGEKGFAVYSTSGTIQHLLEMPRTSVIAFSILNNEKNCIIGTVQGGLYYADITNATILHSVQAHNKMIVSIAQSPNQQYVAVASIDNTISIHRTDNLQEVGRIYGSSSDFLNVAFSPDGKSISASSADGSVRVWNFDVQYELQSYTMSRSFSIVRPHFLTSSIMVGAVEQGQQRDSVFSGRLRNPHSVPLWVGVPMVYGTDSAAFHIVSGGNRFVPPHDSIDVEIRFAPMHAGEHNARLAFPSVEDTTYLSIQGVGLPPSVVISHVAHEGIDVGDEIIGGSKIVVLDNLVRNISPSDMRVVSVTIEQGHDAFAIERSPSVLARGMMLSFSTRFMPQRIGLASCRIRVTLLQTDNNSMKTLSLVVTGTGVADIVQGTLGLYDDKGQTVDTLRIRRTPVRTVQPLLPYIFFEENADSIPPRYHVRTAIRENVLRSKNAMEAHFYILDIIGERLRRSSSAHIELTGCNANTGREKNNLALSRRRAESVRQYWVQNFGIHPKRISVVARNLPLQPSQGKETESFAENRRVEIIASQPDIMSAIDIIDTLQYVQPGIMMVRFASQTSNTQRVHTSDSLLPACSRIPLALTLRTGLGVLTEEKILVQQPLNALWNIGQSIPQIPWHNGIGFVSAVPKYESSPLPSLPCGVRIDGCTIIIKVEADSTEHEAFSRQAERWNLILFPYNSSSLSEQNKSVIRTISKKIEELTTRKNAVIEGYTDTIGEFEYNKELSLRRARSVAQLLHLPTSSCFGMGEEIALYPNALPEGRFLNRTVRITLR